MSLSDWWEPVEKRFHCDHTSTNIVRYTQSNNVEIVRIQCQRCGANLGSRKKANYDLASLPEWDEALQSRWTTKYQEARDTAWAAYQAAIERDKTQADREWWRKYNYYLGTPDWHTLRAQVIKRDEFKCQGCFRSVTLHTAHCHHISYVGFNRVGRSFGFEVVTLCHACHERYHND